jgi:hypothetical protein
VAAEVATFVVHIERCKERLRIALFFLCQAVQYSPQKYTVFLASFGSSRLAALFKVGYPSISIRENQIALLGCKSPIGVP